VNELTPTRFREKIRGRKNTEGTNPQKVGDAREGGWENRLLGTASLPMG